MGNPFEWCITSTFSLPFFLKKYTNRHDSFLDEFEHSKNVTLTCLNNLFKNLFYIFLFLFFSQNLKSDRRGVFLFNILLIKIHKSHLQILQMSFFKVCTVIDLQFKNLYLFQYILQLKQCLLNYRVKVLFFLSSELI